MPTTQRNRTAPAIVVTGVYQLITAVATIRANGLHLEHAPVLAFGHINDSLAAMIEHFCGVFGLRFVGTLPRHLRYPIGRRELLRWGGVDWWVRPEKYAGRKLLSRYPVFRELLGRPLVTPFRASKDDALMECALSYPDVLYYAEGASIWMGPWSHRGWRLRGVRSLFKQLPVARDIWYPAGLEQRMAQLGNLRRIPEEIHDRAWRDTSQSSQLVQCSEWLSGVGPRSVLLSQYLAPACCTDHEEILFFSRIISDLVTRGDCPVLFKPHPKDNPMKIAVLKEMCKQFGADVRFMSMLWTAIPVEALALVWGPERCVIAGACSTAILSMPKLFAGLQPVCYTSPQLPAFLRNQVDEVAHQGGAQIRTVPLVS
jgi:hypothetical protein